MTNERFKIASYNELSEPGSRVVGEINEREIAVFNIENELFAISNYCIHQGGPLCEGQLTGQTKIAEDGWDLVYEDEGQIIQCPWHTWKFNVKTGKNIDDDRLGVPTYDVEIDGGDVFIIL